MDEEMEDMVMLTFTAVEIDPDYEFDAAQYFDFSREESLAKAREAELWFESAGTYPPSRVSGFLHFLLSIMYFSFG